jgi:Activator of Hsp90 ATPase homolog 1-like protein
VIIKTTAIARFSARHSDARNLAQHDLGSVQIQALAHPSTMTMTWEVTALDAGTRVDIRADDVPAGISAKDHAAGLASSLANLATYLEQ